MLIIAILVNEKTIDTICVQNAGEYRRGKGLFKYKIIKPEGFEDIEILHQRSKSYVPLVEQVMSWLKCRDYGTIKSEL